jgi:hypothetical protein
MISVVPGEFDVKPLLPTRNTRTVHRCSYHLARCILEMGLAMLDDAHKMEGATSRVQCDLHDLHYALNLKMHLFKVDPCSSMLPGWMVEDPSISKDPEADLLQDASCFSDDLSSTLRSVVICRLLPHR